MHHFFVRAPEDECYPQPDGFLCPAGLPAASARGSVQLGKQQLRKLMCPRRIFIKAYCNDDTSTDAPRNFITSAW